jgi:hypothetical protein
MRFVPLQRADGTTVYVNATLVRAVAVTESDKSTSLVQFDQDHVILIRELAEKVAQLIQAST